MKTRLTKLVLLICLVLQASVNFAADRITFIHTDASGTPIAGSDENGKLAWKAEYYPFGDQFETASKFRESTLGFTGKPYEKDIGLNYFGARFYDPLTGRFISMDPAPIEASNHYSVNRYAYANNNPYKYIDPDGRLPVIPILIFLAKEIAADKLSQATGGASDFLSVRRAASKVARVFSKKVSKNRGGSVGAMRRYTFDPSPKHGASARNTSKGVASPGPKDGQHALDNSVQVKSTSTRRVGVDKENREITVFDQTSEGVFHGHVRSFEDLTSQQQNALKKAGLVDKKSRF